MESLESLGLIPARLLCFRSGKTSLDVFCCLQPKKALSLLREKKGETDRREEADTRAEDSRRRTGLRGWSLRETGAGVLGGDTFVPRGPPVLVAEGPVAPRQTRVPGGAQGPVRLTHTLAAPRWPARWPPRWPPRWSQPRTSPGHWFPVYPCSSSPSGTRLAPHAALVHLPSVLVCHVSPGDDLTHSVPRARTHEPLPRPPNPVPPSPANGASRPLSMCHFPSSPLPPL